MQARSEALCRHYHISKLTCNLSEGSIRNRYWKRDWSFSSSLVANKDRCGILNRLNTLDTAAACRLYVKPISAATSNWRSTRHQGHKGQRKYTNDRQCQLHLINVISVLLCLVR